MPDIIEMQLERGGGVSQEYLDGLHNKKEAERLFGEVLKFYKKKGPPVYRYSEQAKFRIFSNLRSMNVSEIIKDGVIRSHPCGSGLASSYFPHMWGVKCRHFKTIEDCFGDEKLLRRTIHALMFRMGTHVSTLTLRSFLAFAQGIARPSNFRPSAAKAIYTLFAKDKIVWDMSCGWGGRLLGAMACPVKKYIGTDPSTKTFEGLKALSKEIGQWSATEVELHCCGSEVFVPKEPVDLCFTSPPYFDVEKYSDEETQSYVKFPSLDKWLNGFLFSTVKNCHKCLRKDGVLSLNIWPKFEEPTIEVCERAGFKLVRTLQLALSMLPGKNRTKKPGSSFKYEPVLIFKKKA